MSYKNNLTNRKGFTLIELLVVIAIIGLLSTLAVIALGGARAKARDSRRVADVKQLATALELYYADNNSYPAVITPGQALTSPNGGTTYLGRIPSNPTPRTDGNCADSDYIYTPSAGNGWFNLSFCTSSKISDLNPGALVISPSGVQQANAVEGFNSFLEEYKKDLGYYPADLTPGEPLINPNNNKVYIDHVPDLRQGDCSTYKIFGPFCVTGQGGYFNEYRGRYKAVYASESDAQNRANAISYYWTFYSTSSSDTMKGGVNTVNKNGTYSSAHEWSVTVPEVLAHAESQGCTVARDTACENNFINNYVDIRKNWEGRLRELNIYSYCYASSSCLMDLKPWSYMNSNEGGCKLWKKAGITQSTGWITGERPDSQARQITNDCPITNVGYR